MATITRAKTGRTIKAKESFGEFKRRRRRVERAKLAARRIRARGGKAFVETIEGQPLLVQVKKPDQFELIQEGRVVKRGTKADLVREKAKRTIKPIKKQEFKVTSIERFPSQIKISSISKKQVKTKLLGRIDKLKLSKIEATKRKFLGITQKERGTPKSLAAGTIGLGTIGFVQGVGAFVGAIKNPKKFAKDQVEFVKRLKSDPKGTSRAVVKEFEINPAGFIAEFAGFAKSFQLTARAAKKSPVGRFVAEEAFIRNQPKELQKSVRAILKTSKAQEKIGFTTRKLPKKVSFAEVKELKPVEQRALKKALQKTDSIVFGSAASRLLSGKTTKVPKDVDLATSDIGNFNREFLKSLPTKARSDFIIKKESVVRKSSGQKLFDVKPLNRLIPQKSFITRRGELPITGRKDKVTFIKDSQLVLPQIEKKFITEQFIPTQKLQTVEGIKFVGLGEQTTRKGLGTLQVLLEKNTRRAKDPAAFIESIEIQIKGLQKKKTKNIISRKLKEKKIRDLQKGLSVLKNKDFAKLLDKKSVGLTKNFPLISKIDAKKLKSFQKKRDKQTRDVFLDVDKLKFVDLGKKVRKPFLEKPSKIKSASRLRKPSKVPSKLRKPSKIKRVVSKTPSRTKKPSRTPSKVKKPSKVPSRVPSKVPSTIKAPSKITSSVPSRLDAARAKPLKIFKLPKLFRKPKKIKKKIRIKKLKKPKPLSFAFTSTIETPSKKTKFKTKKGKLIFFTGTELRSEA